LIDCPQITLSSFALAKSRLRSILTDRNSSNGTLANLGDYTARPPLIFIFSGVLQSPQLARNGSSRHSLF
jgi:hypothetical protein